MEGFMTTLAAMRELWVLHNYFFRFSQLLATVLPLNSKSTQPYCLIGQVARCSAKISRNSLCGANSDSKSELGIVC